MAEVIIPAAGGVAAEAGKDLYKTLRNKEKREKVLNTLNNTAKKVTQKVKRAFSDND